MCRTLILFVFPSGCWFYVWGELKSFWCCKLCHSRSYFWKIFYHSTCSWVPTVHFFHLDIYHGNRKTVRTSMNFGGTMSRFLTSEARYAFWLNSTLDPYLETSDFILLGQFSMKTFHWSVGVKAILFVPSLSTPNPVYLSVVFSDIYWRPMQTHFKTFLKTGDHSFMLMRLNVRRWFRLEYMNLSKSPVISFLSN